jgi:hypothetical protein
MNKVLFINSYRTICPYSVSTVSLLTLPSIFFDLYIWTHDLSTQLILMNRAKYSYILLSAGFAFTQMTINWPPSKTRRVCCTKSPYREAKNAPEVRFLRDQKSLKRSVPDRVTSRTRSEPGTRSAISLESDWYQCISCARQVNYCHHLTGTVCLW